MTHSDIKLNREFKDSVFGDLFSHPRYAGQLVQDLLHLEKPVPYEDIEDITINNVLTTGQFNDLGLLVQDQVIILAEAQSTWSENILIRSILYLAESLKRFKVRKELDLFSPKKVSIPEPALFVIYTGSDLPKKEQLCLSEEFFNGRKTDLEVIVHVLTIYNSHGIVREYIQFCQMMDRNRKRFPDDPLKAIQKTMEECQKMEFLSSYLSERREEVVHMEMALFSQEEALKAAMNRIKKESEEIGIKIGEEKGIKIGEEKGIKIGEEKGIKILIGCLLETGMNPAEISKILSSKYNITLEAADQTVASFLENGDQGI